MKLCFEKQDGSVAIFHAAPKEDLELVLGPLTDEEYMNHITERVVTPYNYKSVRQITDEELPKDYYFRDAWVADPQTKIKVDMDKARAVHLSRIREARDVQLAELDIETMKGKDVQAEKQVLRDLPQKINLKQALTPEALKNTWPVELVRDP